MKNLIKTYGLLTVLVVLSLSYLSSCENKDATEDTLDTTLTENDKSALLFMIEEEKLARDTYIYLDNLWAINQFSDIKNSEQTHMNAIISLLEDNKIEYTILPAGEFENQDLQNYYNQFIDEGSKSIVNALKIGATIEDLDIVDLENYIKATSNTSIISVFESLQCGSKNHLNSFMSGIVNNGSTYTPQFLTQEAFDAILAQGKKQCN
jgi:hypothetical protein